MRNFGIRYADLNPRSSCSERTPLPGPVLELQLHEPSRNNDRHVAACVSPFPTSKVIFRSTRLHVDQANMLGRRALEAEASSEVDEQDLCRSWQWNSQEWLLKFRPRSILPLLRIRDYAMELQ